MKHNYQRHYLILLVTLLLIIAMLPVSALAAPTPQTVQGLTFSATNDAVTFPTVDTNSIKINIYGGAWKTVEDTITVTNSTGSKAQISFSYTTSTGTGDEATINGCSLNGSTATVTLENGGTFSIYLKIWGTSAGNVSITLSDITVTPVLSNVNVSVAYDSTLGSVYDHTSGTTSDSTTLVSAGSTVTTSATTSRVLTATPNTGATFIAWVDPDDTNKVLSTNATYTVVAGTEAELKVKAVFASTTPWFYVNSSQNLIEGLSAATAYSGTIVLANNATLPAGNYTIPSGVTLLIPYNSAHTVITDTPVTVELPASGSYTAPTIYRTLTMDSGANLTVAGSMSVAAPTAAPGAGYHLPNGGTYDAIGRIAMNSGSSITVTGGLYCYGYITGSGTITAESGAVVYERFEIADYRGGGASSYMNNNSETYKVFPMSQYYIQNIEVPLTLKSGAKEYAWTAIDLSAGTKTTKVNMIGNTGDFMFGLTSGYVTKRYDSANDRQVYDIYGDVSLNHISIVMDAGLAGTVTIDSANFVLPITNSMTINVHSGTATANQALALLPEAIITIDSGAKVVLAQDVHVYDLDQWGAYIYQNSSAPTATMRQARWRPSGMATRTLANDASIVVNGELVATTGALYTTESGAAITSTGSGTITLTAGSQEIAYQGGRVYDANSGGLISDYRVEYHEIPITSAQLMHDDGTYFATTSASSSTYNYNADHGKWVLGEHTITDEVTAPTCTEKGYTTHTCTCGYSYTDTEVDALGHDFTEKVESVCTVANAGNCQTCKTYYVDCSRCDQDGTETWTGTTYGEHVQATSYSSDGTNHWYECTVCGKDLNKAECSGGTATCTAKAFCTVCGNQHGETLAHDYETTYRYDGSNHWHKCTNCSATTDVATHTYTSVVTAPTCTAEGYTTYTCACGYSYTGNETAMAEHAYVDHEAKAPSCTTVGWDAYQTCENCTYSSYVEKPALGHTEVIDAAVAATCTTTGLTQGKHCSACNAVLVAQEVVDALGHTEVVDAAVAATCTATGLTEGKHCSVCKEVLVAQTVTDKLAHTEETIPAVEATCTQKGSTAGVKCSVCGTVIIAPTETDMAAHTEVVDAAVAATCTSTGLTEGSHCGVCNQTLVAQETVAALGHTEVVDAYQAPTCAVTGLTEGKHCSVCGVKTVPQNEIPKLETHTWENGQCKICGISSEDVCTHTPDEKKTVVTNPTCIDAGYTTYTCGTCGLVYTGDPVDAKGHTPGDAATCTTAQTCTVCGVQLAAAIGHNYTAVVTAPTCTAQGYITHTCSNCNDSYQDSYTDTIAHTSGEPVEENRINPTCTDAGSYDSVIRCTVCNTVISSTPNTIPAAGHSMPDTWTQTKAPTCTEAGEQRKDCANCDYYVTQPIAATGHSETAAVTAPTCTAEGYTTYTCTTCGNVRQDNNVAALGHTAGEVVVENKVDATCTAAGSYDNVVYCTVCKAEVSRETVTVAAPGHTSGAAQVENETPATCGKEGSYDSVVYCTVCNTELSRTPTTIPATGDHNYTTEKERVEATCTEDGYVIMACACGAEETTVLKAPGHDEIKHEAKAPTCIEPGWDAYVTCSRCNYTTYEEKAATGEHSDSAEDTDHICDTEGCEEVMNDCSDAEDDGDHKCDTCGKDAVSDHTEAEAVREDVVNATCGSAGSYDLVVYCSECGAELSREKITENATGNHSYSSSITKEATCVEAGVRTYTCSGCGSSYTEEIPATGNHDWKAATYTAPKTCSVCKLTEGEPLVDVENPENIPAEDIEKALDAMVKVTDAIQPEDSGMEADTNKGQLEETTTAVGGISYNTSLVITLNAVVVDKDGEAMIAKKITYDVIPMLHILDEAGIQIDEQKITSFETEITFRLPVDKNTTAGFARVWHAETENLGLHKIQTDADGNKFVEVKSKKFSEFTLELEEECTEHTYGEDGKCTICGAEKPVAPNMPVPTTNTSQVAYQVGLIEPWFLRINILIRDVNGSVIDPATFENYGAYAIRKSKLTDAENAIANADYEAIINAATSTAYEMGSEVSVHEPDNHAVFRATVNGSWAMSFRYRENIYTYEMDDPIVYFAWYVDEDGLHYTDIREESIMARVKKNITSTKFPENERIVYEKMSQLYDDILTHRGNGETVLPAEKLVTASNSNIGIPNTNNPYTFQQSQQIILIEPWGIRINALVKQNGSILDYSALEDYGIIFYHAKDNVVPESVEALLDKQDEAYVFSKSNDNASLGVVNGSNAFYARYRNDIYTYELDSTLCYCTYIVVDGEYYYSNVWSKNIMTLANDRANSSSTNYSDTEKVVYRDMVELCEVVVAYRSDD